MKRMYLLTILTIICIVTVTGWTQEVVLSTYSVKASGIGVIKDGNKADARQTAIRDAQRNAVEQMTGTFINSETRVKNFQLLQDKIYAQASGFITDYTIEQEKAEGNNYYITIKASIKIETLRAELISIGLLMEAKGYPKIMLIVDEVIKKDDQLKVVDDPVLTSGIENALLSKGFILVAKDYSDALRLQERDLMAEVFANDQKAADMALSYGAEVIIVGTNTITDLGIQTTFNQADATASIRAILASTAQVIASVQEQKRGGADRPENAYIEASKKLSSAISDNLIKRILQNWQQVQKRGSHFVVKLYGITSYRNQGMAFIKMLRAINDVTSVEQRSFGGGRLEVDVRYHRSLDELVSSLWEQMDKNSAFDQVDQKEAIGNNVIFEFMQ